MVVFATNYSSNRTPSFDQVSEDVQTLLQVVSNDHICSDGRLSTNGIAYGIERSVRGEKYATER
jgi:hypothetical protein